MNKEEAQQILAEHLSIYKRRSYSDLSHLLNKQETTEVTAPSGSWYQLEFEVFWDDKPNGNLRVIGSIDDGGLRAFFPLTDDFMITPEGKFIGE